MSVEIMLRDLAAGEPVQNGAVLQYARCQTLGREIYGEEEVIEHFRHFPLVGEGQFLSCEQHAALIWPDRALFVDLSAAHVLRLWRLGPGNPLERERQVSVPFDADMMQARGNVVMQASDHPALSATDLARTEQAGRSLAQNWRDVLGAPALRARAFCIRAFSAGDAAVALFAVHVVKGVRERTTSFVPALAVIKDDTTIVRDATGEASEQLMSWRPRVT